MIGNSNRSTRLVFGCNHTHLHEQNTFTLTAIILVTLVLEKFQTLVKPLRLKFLDTLMIFRTRQLKVTVRFSLCPVWKTSINSSQRSLIIQHIATRKYKESVRHTRLM